MSHNISNRIDNEVMKHDIIDQSLASKVDYFQIDTIRFITIFFIIWGHSLFSQWGGDFPSDFKTDYFKIITLQLGKISTPIFFVVAGFLLRPKLKHYNLRSYFADRGPKIYIPWILFIAIFFFLQFFQEVKWIEIFVSHDFKKLISMAYIILNGLLLYTTYWFITTYLVSITLIVVFKNYAEKWWFGVILTIFFLFYAVNLYYQWVAANHAKAILGYAFFVWLGIIISKHFKTFSYYLHKLPWFVIIISMLGFFYVACYEGVYLSKIGSIDPYSSNRISNGIFSMIFFIAMMKFGPISIINKLNPRKTVYGIFLIHNLIIFQLTVWSSMFDLNYLIPNLLLLFLCQIAFCLFIVFISYGIVTWMKDTKLSWLIGLKEPKRLIASDIK